MLVDGIVFSDLGEEGLHDPVLTELFSQSFSLRDTHFSDSSSGVVQVGEENALEVSLEDGHTKLEGKVSNKLESNKSDSPLRILSKLGQLSDEGWGEDVNADDSRNLKKSLDDR